jgi:uncharacterized repeat protein (TIGR02543 family)
MKKLFLTSGLVLCMASNAMATTDIGANQTGSLTSGCTDTYLGTYSGATAFTAKWETNVSGAITLNSNRWASNSDSNAASTASTAAAPTPLYSVYDVGMYNSAANAAARGTTGKITAITTAPIMTGYTFDGFYTTKATGGAKVINADKSFVSGAENIISASGGEATWYARWTPKSYTITFAKNSKDIDGVALVDQSGTAATPSGTTGSSNTQSYNYDETKNLTANGFSVAGYDFGGWTTTTDITNVSGGSASYTNQQSIKYKYPNNATLTAKWVPVPSGAITLDSSVYPGNDYAKQPTYTTSTTEAVTAPTYSTIYTVYNTKAGSEAGAPTELASGALKPAKYGYTFNGYYDSTGVKQYVDNGGNVTETGKRAVNTKNGTAKFYANWTPKTATATYKAGSHGTGSDVTQTLTYDSAWTTKTFAQSGFAANTGYTFSKWNTNTGGTGTNYSANTGQSAWKSENGLTLYAIYTANCSGQVTLDSDMWASSTASAKTYTASPAASPASLYVKYDTGLYTNNACSSTTGLTNSKITIPTLTGYDFGGFYNTKSGTGTQMIDNTGAITANGKTALPTSSDSATWWAKWTAKTINLTYTCGTAPTVSGLTPSISSNTPPAATTVTFDSSKTLAETTTCALTGERGGYHFGGWHCSIDPDDGSGTKDYESSYSSNAWRVSKTVNPWKAASDVTCSAIWRGNTYTISYATGTAGSRTTGFSGTMDSQTVEFGKDHEIPENTFSITGYTFNGWKGDYDNATGNAAVTSYTNSYAFQPYKIAHDLKLTAQWTANCSGNVGLDAKRYTSASDATGTAATTDVSPTAVNVKYDNGLYKTGTSCGTAATITKPTMTGYTFGGFYNSKANATAASPAASTQMITAAGAITDYGKTAVPTGTATWFAKWTANTYTVTYDRGSCGSSNGTAYTHTNGATYNSNYTVPSAASSAMTVKTGYTFQGWNTVTGKTTSNFPDASATPWTRTSGLTVYAACTPNQNTVSYECGDKPGSEPLTASSGSTPAAPAVDTFTYDSSYALPNNAGTCQYNGWHFDGWNCNYVLTSGATAEGFTASYASGATGTFKVNTSVKCKAKWARNNISITWTPGAGATAGVGTSGDTSCNYDSTLVVPSAPSKTGYTFKGWTVSGH